MKNGTVRKHKKIRKKVGNRTIKQSKQCLFSLFFVHFSRISSAHSTCGLLLHVQLIVNLVDMNDNYPTFPLSQYIVQGIAETVAVGTDIIQGLLLFVVFLSAHLRVRLQCWYSNRYDNSALFSPPGLLSQIPGWWSLLEVNETL